MNKIFIAGLCVLFSSFGSIVCAQNELSDADKIRIREIYEKFKSADKAEMQEVEDQEITQGEYALADEQVPVASGSSGILSLYEKLLKAYANTLAILDAAEADAEKGGLLIQKEDCENILNTLADALNLTQQDIELLRSSGYDPSVLKVTPEGMDLDKSYEFLKQSLETMPPGSPEAQNIKSPLEQRKQK